VTTLAPVRARFGRRSAVAALAVIATVALAACTAGGGASPSPRSGGGTAALEGTPWTLTDYVGPQGGTIPVPEAIAATASFTGGVVAGNAGCNDYRGSYTIDGDKLAISGVSSTMKACPPAETAVETAFLKALGNVATFAVTGQVLELKTAEGKVGLRFAASVSPTLTKTRWVAISINNGTGGTASVIADSTVTAVFGDDGGVAGSGGCNNYSGTYTVNASALSFGPLVSTKKACAVAEVSQQEANYFAALGKVSQFAFKGDHLQLRDAAGALQVEYRPTLP
jgi:heat shock protein HslJ